LKQLDEAVRAYAEEDPTSHITVVVDASFEHRIDESERETLREAMLNGEVVSPPAGAIGRGDAFVLRIAERTGAVVLSNDSFQEFHGQHPWLFDNGRLIGGKPVPGVGWIFTPRLPIRGPKSRAATAESRSKVDPESAPAKAAELARAAKKAAKRSVKKAAPVVDTSWPLVPSAPPPRTSGRAPAPVDPELSSAISEAVAEALDPPRPEKAAKSPSKKKAAAKGDAGPKHVAAKKSAAKKAVPAKKVVTSKKEAPAKKIAGAKKSTAKKAMTAKKEALAKKAAPEMKTASAKKSAAKKAVPAKKSAAKKAAAPVVPDRSGRKRRAATPPPAVNAPLSFITFVATYPVGTMVEGEVVSFTSHGAMVDVALPDGGGLHCYIPLSAMGHPPPTKARQVLKKGEVRSFVLSSLDPPRRVAELSLPVVPAKRRGNAAKKAKASS
jgi:hypothetical protein